MSHAVNTRRRFLTRASFGLLSAAAACRRSAPAAGQLPQPTPGGEPPIGAPPAFGTAPAVGPSVNAGTFAEAEKLVNAHMTAREREQAARNWRNSMAALYERRTGPRRVVIEPELPPYSRWDPVLSPHDAPTASLRPRAEGGERRPGRDQFIWSEPDAGPLPSRDEDIAFAPVTQLAGWIRTRA